MTKIVSSLSKRFGNKYRIVITGTLDLFNNASYHCIRK